MGENEEKFGLVLTVLKMYKNMFLNYMEDGFDPSVSLGGKNNEESVAELELAIRVLKRTPIKE